MTAAALSLPTDFFSDILPRNVSDYPLASGGACDPAYFEMTLENLVQSEVVLFYTNWTINAKATEPGFAQYGEVAWFGRSYLNDLDSDCGIGYGNGCNKDFDCSTILAMYPDNPDLARKVYFATKIRQRVFMYYHLYWVSQLS